MTEAPLSRIEQVEEKTGWLTGLVESKEAAVKRVTEELNMDGYYIETVYPAGDFSPMKQLKIGILTLLSLGFYGRRPGMIVVAKRAKRI